MSCTVSKSPRRFVVPKMWHFSWSFQCCHLDGDRKLTGNQNPPPSSATTTATPREPLPSLGFHLHSVPGLFLLFGLPSVRGKGPFSDSHGTPHSLPCSQICPGSCVGHGSSALTCFPPGKAEHFLIFPQALIWSIPN